MTADFAPILKQNLVEQFVSSNESLKIVTNIFISAGLMVFAMMITWLFIWSYQKNTNLFIAFIACVAMLFSLEWIILTIINMSKYDEISFKVSMGSGILNGLIFFILAMTFFIRFFQDSRGDSGSRYVPSTVSNYIDQ
jgi:O-antigen/teichoic acid export membrane protein